MSEYVDLRHIVERAGLPWEEASAALGDPEAQKAAQAHATELAVYSLWGVPSIRRSDVAISSRGVRIDCHCSPIGCADTRSRPSSPACPIINSVRTQCCLTVPNRGITACRDKLHLT